MNKIDLIILISTWIISLIMTAVTAYNSGRLIEINRQSDRSKKIIEKSRKV